MKQQFEFEFVASNNVNYHCEGLMFLEEDEFDKSSIIPILHEMYVTDEEGNQVIVKNKKHDLVCIPYTLFEEIEDEVFTRI